jgi:TolB protein
MKRTAILTLALLALAASSVHAAFPGRNGAIAYGWSRVAPQDSEHTRYAAGISMVTSDRSEPRSPVGCEEVVASDTYPPPRTCTLDSFSSPAFSPEGTRVAFDAGASIALVALDGASVAHRLLAHSDDDGEPAFSPNGRQLAFSAGTDVSGHDIRRSIWVMEVDGSGARQISPHGSEPAWSSRNVIAFVRSGEIWVMRPNGSRLRKVTGGGGFAPAWSPDGTKIAFSRHGSIFVVDPAAHRLRRVARWMSAVGLAWSPDGRRLAIRTYLHGLRTIALDGSHLRSLRSEDLGELFSFGHCGIDWQPLPRR